MASVKEHYDVHLGKFYSWMLGDFTEKSQEQLQYFREQKIVPGDNGVAIDLGCGNGVQSVALADLGFRVIAVDFNKGLLDELRANAGNRNISVVEASITDIGKNAPPGELVVCMGDTITHLDSVEQVEKLLQDIFNVLVPGGRVVFSFREMMLAMEGDNRFIPVKSDDGRILTCFLEYHEGYVIVHDLLYEKEDGGWKFVASSYRKLRLGLNQLVGMLVKVGFGVSGTSERNGMVYIIARK